jgi:cobalt-precorrin 5A hydrolase / precorrin-3B C17-methyltransferase
VIPGVSALQAAAARAGAPLGHDFCAISPSDLLTPWSTIEQRLVAAAVGDFVVALYNPRSARRATQLAAARSILLAHRPAATPVAVARNLGRDSESLVLTTLAELDPGIVDMLTLVIVGNSETRLISGRLPRIYTPRGYGGKLAIAGKKDDLA